MLRDVHRRRALSDPNEEEILIPPRPTGVGVAEVPDPSELEDPAIAREDGDPPWTAELWPEGRVRPAPKMRRLAQWTVLPLAAAVGVCTSMSNIIVELSAELFGDLRMGSCMDGSSWVAKSRMACCGGANYVDHHSGGCRAPILVTFKRDPYAGDLNDPESLSVEVGKTWQTYENGPLWPFSVFTVGSMMMGTASALLMRIEPSAAGSGLPEFKAAVGGLALPNSFTPRTLGMKMLGLSLSVASGLPLGKEGPMVSIGACWAAISCTAFEKCVGALPIPRHELLCSGAAAGVSSAFGAPLGGVLFAVEESGGVPARAIVPALVSAVCAALTLQAIDLTGTQEMTLFGVTYKSPWAAWELCIFTLIGAAGGLLGALFVHLNGQVQKMRLWASGRERFWWFPRVRLGDYFPHALVVVMEVICLTVLVSFTSYPMRVMRVFQNEAIHGLFSTQCRKLHAHELPPDPFGLCGQFASLFCASAIRLAQTVLAYGASLPAGVFTPSLFIGGTLGRSIGELLRRHVGDAVEPGIYAMVGAGSMLAGVTRITVSLVVIMFELTDGLNYVVPFMLAVLTANVIGNALTDSITDRYAALGRVAFVLNPPSDIVRMEATVLDLVQTMSPTVKVVWADSPTEVGGLVAKEGIAVVKHKSLVGVGWVAQADVDLRAGTKDDFRVCVFRSEKGKPRSGVLDWTDLIHSRGIILVRHDCTLMAAFSYFRGRPDLQCLVCVQNEHIVGAITRRMFTEGLMHAHLPVARDMSVEQEELPRFA